MNPKNDKALANIKPTICELKLVTTFNHLTLSNNDVDILPGSKAAVKTDEEVLLLLGVVSVHAPHILFQTPKQHDNINNGNKKQQNWGISNRWPTLCPSISFLQRNLAFRSKGAIKAQSKCPIVLVLKMASQSLQKSKNYMFFFPCMIQLIFFSVQSTVHYYFLKQVQLSNIVAVTQDTGPFGNSERSKSNSGRNLGSSVLHSAHDINS